MTMQFAANGDAARSDGELVRVLLHGADVEFDAAATMIYRRHSAAVLRFATMIAPSKEIAFDGTQKAFIWLTTSGEKGGAGKFDAAGVIGCPIGTIRSRLSRAKARLKTILAELLSLQNRNNP